MIGYIEGKVVDLTPSRVYIDINGLGYDVNITLNTFENIKDQSIVKLYTHLQVREDAWVLYGFATIEEKESFQKLLSVSGVGAVTARILLSSLSTNDFSRIVANGDNKALEKVKGIGAKTAQRIILELKGKLSEATLEAGKFVNTHNSIDTDALNALLGLGIPKATAESAIKKSKEQLIEVATVEELIKTALKNL